jgi:hypothetical protein
MHSASGVRAELTFVSVGVLVADFSTYLVLG